MAKVIKSFSLDPDVAAFLEARGNASGEINKLVRRQMLSEQVEHVAGRRPRPGERDAARRWARRELDEARAHVEGGAYDEVREAMGWAA